MSRNLRNFERNLDLLEIEQQKSVNLLRRLSLSQFVEHIIDPNEVPVQDNNTESEPIPSSSSSGNIDQNKFIIDISINSLSTPANNYMSNDTNTEASSVIGGDSVINNNKKTFPMIIGSDVFNSVQSIDAPSTSTLQKQMTISQIGGPMSSSVIQKIPNQSIPSSNTNNNTTVQMQPIVNNPSIPTPPPLAPPSVPSVPAVPSVPTPPPSVPTPPPSVPTPPPSVPTPPPQNPSFPPVAMQPNVGGPGVPLPPPLIIPSIKPPQPKPKPSAPPKKKIEIPKERPKTMQELLAEQREKMKKGATAQKASPPIQPTEPSQPKAFPFKLPGMKPPIDDSKDDDDKTEAIQVGLHNLKSDTQQQSTKTEEKKPIIQIKKDPRLELTGKRLNDVFGDDDEDDNNNNKPQEKQQQQVKQEPQKTTSNVIKPPISMGIGMRMPGLSNQFKPSPPPTTSDTGNTTSSNNENESNKPPASGFGNKLSNLEKLFASGFGMGMSTNMAQTQKASTQRSVIDTEIQVQKSEYENILSKNNNIIQKKKPKKKAFGVVNDSGNTQQLKQQKTLHSSTITPNIKTENKPQLPTASAIKPESIKPSKLAAKDLFTDTDTNTNTDTNANTNTNTSTTTTNTNNPPTNIQLEPIAKSSVVKPPQQKPTATKRLTFLYDDEE